MEILLEPTSNMLLVGTSSVLQPHSSKVKFINHMLILKLSKSNKDSSIGEILSPMIVEVKQEYNKFEHIIFDRDRRFTSYFLKSLNKALGTRLDMSTTYHPQSDGQSERTNQTWKTCYMPAYSTLEKCQSPIYWAKVGDSQLTGPKIIHEITEKIIQIKSRIHAARDRQKSYADLNPRYIRPFKIIAKVGTVSYRLELLEQLSRVHSTFHVSNLKKCLTDETLAIPLDEIQVDDKLHFIEEPIEIMDQEVKRLKQSRIPIMKMLCPKL
nr:hypothetical protein [Tanacetum cinerariifolium]